MTEEATSIVPDGKRVKARQYVALAAIVMVTVGFALWALWSSFQPKGQTTIHRTAGTIVTHSIQAQAPVNLQDVWIARSEDQLQQLQDDRKHLEENLGQLRQQFDTLKAQQQQDQAEQKAEDRKLQAATSAARRLPPLPLPPRGAASTMGAATLPQVNGSGNPLRLSRQTGRHPGIGGQRGKASVDMIEELDIPLPASPKADDTRTAANYIPAGSFGRVILLSGLDAPTGGAAEHNPVPILARLEGNGHLPNGFRSRVKACHIVLAGYGDISAERVYARTETLSCVLKNGHIVQSAIKGYLSGEDGKAGMRGRVISKQGALIARALLSGVFGGIGQGISQSYSNVATSALGSVTSVSPNKILQQGVAQGFGTALDRISKWYLDRANETYPVIEVDASRMGDVILTEGVSIGDDSSTPDDSHRRKLVTPEEIRKAATLEEKPWAEQPQ